LRQRRGISDRKGDMKDARQSLGKERLACPRRSNHQNIAFLEIDMGKPLPVHDALVVVVYRDRQDFLCLFLSNHVLIKRRFDFSRLGNDQRQGRR